ncbi:heme/hemin ABC transporter substrate-binding protein [Bdellovibrio sp. HCB209]|uniref:heme/hemin ABC transporter substrate-binding protein n=1 Tax=Bdellovibrio sp. HCB209 TaxID=3394354 RepID=UPI0039B3BEEA
MKLQLLLIICASIVSFSASAAVFKGADGVEVDIKSPKRVIALNTSTVEILYAFKKQDLIVGVDAGSKFPEGIQKTKTNLGHPYRPSVEGMISLKPDLIIAPQENIPATTVEQLRTAKIPVLILEDSGKNGVEGLKSRITLMGKVFESEKEATALIAKLDKQAADLSAKIKKHNKHPKIFFLYAHGAKEAFIYGKQTGSHTLIEAVGGNNAAEFTTGTKPLTAEAMVQASPDVIIMLTRGLTALGGVDGALKLPGVALSKAGKERAIFEVDDSIRWVGPRFYEFADKLYTEINAVK